MTKTFRLWGMTFKSKSAAYRFVMNVEICYVLALILFTLFIYFHAGIVSWFFIIAAAFGCIGPVDKYHIYHKAKRMEMIDHLLSEADDEEKK